MIYLIILLGVFLRSIGLNQSLWLDEAAQAIESVRPLSQQLDIAGDFWPPLYHILLHFWMRISTSEIWLRLLSVMIGIATIYVTYLLATKLVNKKVGLLTAFLLSISPFHVWYSQEIRPYALSALLGILTTYYLLNVSIYRYIATSILFLYSIYLAPFLLITHGIYIFVFVKNRFKQWLMQSSIVVVFFLPWGGHFLQQLNIGKSLIQTLPGWSEAVSTPLLKALPLTFIKFMLGRITFANKLVYAGISIGMFTLVAYCIFLAYRKQRTITYKLLLFTGLPVLLLYIVNFWLPIIAPQRLLFILPFFYLTLSLGITILKKSQLLLISILVLVSGYSLYLYGTNPQFQREQWRQSISFVERNHTANSLVVFAFPDAFAPWQWYSKQIVTSLAIAPTFTVKKAELGRFTQQIVAVDRIFFYHYLTDLTDPAQILPSYFQSLGFTETRVVDFPGVGFISVYEKAIAFH